MTCTFWHPSSGQCRVAAPVVISTVGGPETHWPTTEADGWCGEHETDEADE